MPQLLVTENFAKVIAEFCFGAKVGDPNYVSWLDFDQDGNLDIYEVAYLAKKIGQYIPVPADVQVTYADTWIATWEAEPYEVITRYAPAPTAVIQPLPTDAQIKEAFEPNFVAATVEIVKKMLQQGQTLTILGYSVEYENRYLSTHNYIIAGSSPPIAEKHEVYQLFFKTTLRYQTSFPVVASPIPYAIAIAIAVGIAFLLAAIGVGAFYFLKQLSQPTTQEHKTDLTITNPTDRDITVKLPDGTTTVIPAGGKLDFTNTETETSASIWGNLSFIILGLAALIVVAIVLMSSRKS